MVVEIADINVAPGAEAQFIATYKRLSEIIATTPGCRSVRLTRGVESPSRFMLLVEWDSVDAHLTNFRAGPRYGEWRDEIGPFFVGAPQMEHFGDV